MDESKSKILNLEFRKSYSNFLRYLLQVKQKKEHHYLTLCYYFILQDRIEEAVAQFAHLNKNCDKIEHQLQYDYMAAYLDMSVGYPIFAQARKISKKYLDYPIQ